MLTSLREQASSWVLKILFILLALSFAVWGIGDIFRGTPGVTVAEVGGTDIQDVDFQRAFLREINRLRPLFGPGFTAEQAQSMGVHLQVLDQLVARRLVDLEAHRLGLGVADAVVQNIVGSTRAFQNQAGQFDNAIYEARLRSEGFDPVSYETLVREEIMRNQVVGAIVGGVRPVSALTDLVLRYRFQQRLAEVVMVPSAGVGAIAEPSEAELEAFLADNASTFETPEYRSVTFVALDARQFLDRVRVGDAEIETEYRNRSREFISPERRRIEQVVLPDRQTAEAALARLRGGENMATVAAALAPVGRSDTDLGWVVREDLPAEIGAAAFALEAGGFTEPVESGFGWHVLRVLDVEHERVRSLEDAREGLRADLAMPLAIDEIYAAGTRLEDEVMSGRSLEDAARALDMPLVRITGLAADATLKSGGRAEGLPGDAATFIRVAFESDQGVVSPLVETDAGGAFMLRVDATELPRQPALDEIRARVVAAWRARAQSRRAAEIADAIVARAKAGEPLAEIAAELGLAHTTSGTIRRDGTGAEGSVPQALVAALFDLAPGELAAGPAPDGHAVIRLREVRAPQAEADVRAALERSLTEAMRDGLLGEYQATLQERYRVRINTAAFATP